MGVKDTSNCIVYKNKMFHVKHFSLNNILMFHVKHVNIKKGKRKYFHIEYMKKR